jgi:hypothetical protein
MFQLLLAVEIERVFSCCTEAFQLVVSLAAKQMWSFASLHRQTHKNFRDCVAIILISAVAGLFADLPALQELVLRTHPEFQLVCKVLY